MNSTCWARILALAAEAALVVVDVRQVILDGDCIKLAHLLALATTDTCVGTCLACYSTFVFVHAHHYHSAALWTFLAELDDVAWTRFHTLTATGTFLVVHFW